MSSLLPTADVDPITLYDFRESASFLRRHLRYG